MVTWLASKWAAGKAVRGDGKYSSIVAFLLRRPDYGEQAGMDSSLKRLTRHFVLGYFH
jgi:hypothetical protein